MRTLMGGLTLGCFFVLGGLAMAGPFGTEMGQTPEQFTNLKKVEVPSPEAGIYTKYLTETMPKMNPDFALYSLIFGKDGLAKIIAASKVFKNDGYGNAIRNKYDEIKNQLTKKYGAPKSYDFLKNGSIWNKDKDFMMGIKTKDRVLQSFWKNDNLPDNLSSILLKVRALSPHNGVIYLSYEYKDFSSITEERKKLAEDAL